jgi:serine/threonine protein kinase
VIAAFEKIVVHNMMLQLRRHYRVLRFICAKIEYHCQRYLKVASLKTANQLQEERIKATQKLETVKQAGKEAIDYFKLSMADLVISPMVNSLECYLKLPEVRAKIVNWRGEECPELSLADYTKLEEAAKRKVESRIKMIIEEWVYENRHLENKRQEISDKMSQRLKDVDVNISTVTRALTPIRPVEINPPGFHIKFLPVRMTYIILCANRVFSELCSFKSFDKGKWEMFSQHPVKAMEEMAVNMYHNLLQEQGNPLEKVLSEVISLDQVNTIFKEQVDAAIAKAAKEGEDLWSRETSESLLKTYTPLRDECLNFHTSLLKWELEFLMSGELINSKDIEVKYDCLLGSGHAAGYYLEKSLTEGKFVTVKRFADRDNLKAILQEYECLKKHESAHIGKVLSMTKVAADQSIELVLVMEQAMWSLEDWLKENMRDLGAYKQTSERTLQYLQVGHDISMGLTALHEAGYVHGDLRPSTVLITENGQERRSYRAKLFHFGFRTGIDIPVTSANLSLALDRYSAPERMERTTCKPEMDIYSLGKILWDLWFGTETRPFLRRDKLSQLRKLDGSSEASEQPFSASIKEIVTKGYEPIAPPKNYEELVRECCRISPEKRPRISDITSKLEGIMRDLCDTSIN